MFFSLARFAIFFAGQHLTLWLLIYLKISFKKVPSLLPASITKLFLLILNLLHIYYIFLKCVLETIELSEV